MPGRQREGRVTVACRVVDRTTSAICIDVPQEAEPDLRVWLPMSTIHEIHPDRIICDEWIAKKKGLA